MSKMPINPTRICYLCGIGETDPQNPITDDHVPPRSIFHIEPGEKIRGDLITVPAHRKCNQGHQIDDDYLRVLVVTPAAETHPMAKKLWEKVMRGLRRPQSKGFFKGIQAKLGKYEVRSQSGLYLGKQHGLEIEGSRTSEILFKICRGLHFHHTRQCMPSDIPNEVRPCNEELIAELRKNGQDKKFIGVCNDAFRYIWWPVPGHEPSCFFWLSFYGELDFFISIGDFQKRLGNIEMKRSRD